MTTTQALPTTGSQLQKALNRNFQSMQKQYKRGVKEGEITDEQTLPSEGINTRHLWNLCSICYPSDPLSIALQKQLPQYGQTSRQADRQRTDIDIEPTDNDPFSADNFKDVTDNYDRQLKDMQTNYIKEMSVMSESHRQEMSAMSVKMSAMEDKENIQKSLVSDKQKEISSLNEALKKLQSEATKREEHVRNLQSNIQRVELEAKSLSDRLKLLQSDKGTHADIIKDIADRHDRQMSAMQTKHGQEMSAMETKHGQEMSGMSAKMSAMETKHGQEMSAMSAKMSAMETKHRQEMSATETTHGQEMSATETKHGQEMSAMSAKIEALEHRLKKGFGVWRLPTKLETINIVSNILACVGFSQMAGVFGFLVWVLLALFFWDTVLTVKDNKNKKSAEFGFNVTIGIEILYGCIHPTTISNAVAHTENLIGGQEAAGVYGFLGAIILTLMSIFSLNQSMKKASDKV